MITPEILKSFGTHLEKTAFGSDYYDVDKKGNMVYGIIQTHPGKGLKKNVEQGPDNRGRYTYSKEEVIKRGTPEYKHGVSVLKEFKYGRKQLRKAGIIKRKKILGIF